MSFKPGELEAKCEGCPAESRKKSMIPYVSCVEIILMYIQLCYTVRVIISNAIYINIYIYVYCKHNVTTALNHLEPGGTSEM